RPRTEKSSEDAASRDHRAKQFSFEKFRYEIGHRHGSPAQQPVHILLAELPHGTPGLQHAPEIAFAGIIDIWRRKFQRIANTAADLCDHRLKFLILNRVLLGKLRDFLSSALRIVVKSKRAPVRREGRHADL